FTGDTRQAMAGLLHDVATPAFAHAIDFLNGDYDRQESTEAGAAAAIESSGAIQAALKRCGLTTGDVCDDRPYPIANNPTPGLSADRLEYTLGLAWRRGIAALPEIERLYRDLSVARNEHGEDELAFGSADAAVRFARLALENARMFTADEDRFSMRYLADLLRWALDARVLAPGDLRRTEARLIGALIAHPEGRARWRAFTRLRHVRRADRPGEGYWVKVPAKKRYVDPLVRGKGRASRLSGDLRARISEFQALRFDAWLSGE
ncbi:MAG: hypothetical protein GX558_04875, partial [Clostridiales bacterium]|nr:hypothetical protein [Clostridiales bacterium]